jgi:hypothetical protein
MVRLSESIIGNLLLWLSFADLHTPPSSSAKADDPVRRSEQVAQLYPVSATGVTGCPPSRA